MSNGDLRVIALGNLAGELKTSLEAAARAVGLELLLTREPARAFVELERDSALAVLVDMATLGAEQFCKRARGTERLRSVPVIGMSRHPNELGFARVFAWGADDLVPLGARLPLERRLEALRDTPRPDTSGFGQAVVAEATTQRRALVGRVLAQAGYDVKFAVDRGAVELYASQSETRLVVISAALGDPRRIIEAAAKAGALPTWIVTVEARSTQRLAASLAGLDRVAVTSTAGSPEDVLFLANELVFSKGTRRREWRALYATPVAFRAADSEADEYGFSYDASPGGLYVRSLLPCATEDVDVELRLPNRDERVRLYGKVARRFAFGSGAIASAPPGFSVKIEGPTDALVRWADACSELIAVASSTESMAPRPRSPSQPVLAAPDLGGKPVQLAVPPATVSIESVVAPLPVAMQAAVDAGSDVGELLAATLDEQTLTEVGTRPVTIDPDTMGVREERPSEYAVDTSAMLGGSIKPLEPTISAPPVPVPAAPAVPKTEEPEREALGKMQTVLFAPPEPAPVAPSPSPPAPPAVTPHAADWDSDETTAVRSSSPALDATAPTEPPPSVEQAREQKPGDSSPKAEPAPEPKPAAAPEPKPAAAPEPKPTAAPEPKPEPVEPRAVPAAVAKAPLELPSTNKTLPLGMPKQAAPTPVARKAEAVAQELAAQARPLVARPALAGADPEGEKRGSNRLVLIALALLFALGVGMGLAVITRPARNAANAKGTSPTAPQPPAKPLARAATPKPTTPAPVATPAATPSATPAPSATVAPPPEASAGEAPSAAPTGVATAPAPAPAPIASADLTKLPPERAYLYVRSSVDTHVFVHGTDYGPTNQLLMTTCGIRFVRLGRALGDFVEPGQSRVIKCGRLNEFAIEPR